VDINCEPRQLATLIDHAQSVWTAYGEGEAYWSVLTNESFKQAVFGDSAEEAFYATGAREVAILEAAARRNGLELPTHGRALDFGCGVGRVGEHLSARFASYDGVDVSPPHLKLASERYASVGRENARLLTLGEFLDGRESYDLFFSILVLQHNPPPT